MWDLSLSCVRNRKEGENGNSNSCKPHLAPLTILKTKILKKKKPPLCLLCCRNWREKWGGKSKSVFSLLYAVVEENSTTATTEKWSWWIMHVVWFIYIFLKETKRKMSDWLIIFVLFLCSKRIKYAWNPNSGRGHFLQPSFSFQAVIS